MKNWGFSFLSIILIAVVWEISAAAIASPIILPSFLEVLSKIAECSTTLFFWENVAGTFMRIIPAFLLTLVFGSFLGFCCGTSRTFDSLFAFPLSFIKSTPVVTFILIAIFIFRTSSVPVFASLLMTIPIMVTSVRSGFERSDSDNKKLQMAETYGFSKKQKIKFIILPKLRLFFLNGALSSFGMTWKVVAAAEVLSVPKKALGTLLQESQVHLETANLYAVSFMIVVLSFISELLLKKLVDLSTKIQDEHKTNRQKILISSEEFSPSVPENPQIISDENSNIKIENLNIERGGKKLFKDFSYDFSSLKTTGIIAPSGSGKTTLLNFIAGLLPESNIEGNKKISFLFQEPRLLEQLTLLENVALPLEKFMERKKAYETAYYFLKNAGLEEKILERPQNLSGGEKQRAAIARAFAFPSEILLLDEAFQSLDLQIKFQLAELLRNLLKTQPKTVVFVTHDIHEAIYLCDEILVFSSDPMTIRKKFTIFSESDKSKIEQQIYQEILPAK